MIQIDKSTAPPIIGKFYLVPCIQAKYSVDGYGCTEWIPVVGEIHSDPEIGGDFLHFHYDRRFTGNALISPYKVIATKPKFKNDKFPSHNIKVKYRRKKCYREKDESVRNYAPQMVEVLEPLFENAKMINLTCPHRGVNLSSVPQKRGCVTCPAHGLAWNVESGDMVELV